MAKNNIYLLDTHVFLWWAQDSERLSKKIRDVISDPNNQIFLSVASVLEIIIKRQLKKVLLEGRTKDIVEKSGLDILPITLAHIWSYEKLFLYHKDPFDRILISQAREEDCTLITVDKKIKQYKINLLTQ